MGRWCKRRYIEYKPQTKCFKPRGMAFSELEVNVIAPDELEALRLSDFEGLYQEECAKRMNISRTTFGRTIESARKKVVDCLLHGKALMIEEGDEIMRIAIPTSDGKNISKHVAMSKYFNIYENKELISQIQNPLIENLKEEPLTHSHNSGGLGAGKIIPSLLSKQNVNIFLAREIGEGMKRNLETVGIKIIDTQEKEIQKALELIN